MPVEYIRILEAEVTASASTAGYDDLKAPTEIEEKTKHQKAIDKIEKLKLKWKGMK